MLINGFSNAGALTLAICRPILSGGQSLSVILDAEAGIRCCKPVAWNDLEQFQKSPREDS